MLHMKTSHLSVRGAGVMKSIIQFACSMEYVKFFNDFLGQHLLKNVYAGCNNICSFFMYSLCYNVTINKYHGVYLKVLSVVPTALIQH